MASSAFDALLAKYPDAVRALAAGTRDLVLELLPGARETVDASARVVGYGYGAGYKGTVCAIILSKSGVKLGLARGAELRDPKGLLEGRGKVHRHIAFESTADLHRAGVKPLIRAAAAGQKRVSATS